MTNKKRREACGAMEWDQMLYLLDCLKKDKEYRNLLLVASGCYLGLRISDLLSGITWRILLEGEQVDFTEKKTKKTRRVTINPALKELAMYSYNAITARGMKISKDDLVFVNRWGGTITRQYVNRKLKKIFSRHKIKISNGSISSHVLRKTFGRRIYLNHNQSEAALILLSEIFGHSSTKITRRYLGIQQQVIEGVYLSL